MTFERAAGSWHIRVLLLFLLLTCALTYPLVLHFGSHVPGDGIDDPALAWNLWWVKFSLVDRQLNPFDCRWLFYPVGINLAFYTLTILNGLLSVPLQTALGLVTASNLVLLSSFVLSGYGAYLLTLDVLTERTRASVTGRDRWRDRYAACVAGLFYAFASNKLFYAALGQFNIASSQWVPFAMLYVLRSGRQRGKPRDALLAGLFWLLQAYAELTYASFLAVFLLLYIACWLARMAGRQRGRYQGLGARPAGRQAGAGEGRAAWWPPSLAARLRLWFADWRPQFRLWLPFLRNMALLGAVVAVGLLPFLTNMWPDLRAEGDFLIEGGGFADIFSADLAGFFLPTQLHPLLGGIVRRAASDSALRPDGSQWQVNKGQHLFLGYVAMALALMGLFDGRRRRWRGTGLWVLCTITFFLLTLGPSLRVAGHDMGVPGPFRLLQMLPFFKGNRYPSRYGVMLLASIAPLVATGFRWLLDRLRLTVRPGVQRPLLMPAVPALLVAALLFEHLSIPLPLSDMTVPSIYDTIAADPRSVTVLELPLGWRNGFSVFGKQDVIIMFEQWWQTRHQKPVLGGNTSRNPEYKFRYFLEAPLIGPLTVLANADSAHPHIQAAMAEALAALRAGSPDLGGNQLLQQAVADAPAVLESLDVGYVVVHQDRVPPEFVTFVEKYLPLQRLAAEGPHLLYRVQRSPAAGQVTIWPASEPLTRGEGWSGWPQAWLGGRDARQGHEASSFLWAQRRKTRLLVPPLAGGPKQVTVRARAAGPGQTLTLHVNGFTTAAQPLPEEWSELHYELPAGVFLAEGTSVELRFVRTFPVSEVLHTYDREEDLSLGLLVESAGLEAGNYGHIWFNGRDLAPNTRGYNLAIIDGERLTVRAAAAFDTHADPAASERLREFLQQLGARDILAVAVRDTAADQLTEPATAALTALGLSDLRGRFRWGQAAIVLNAGDSRNRQVVERVSPMAPVSVGYGSGWREPQVAAAVQWIRIEEGKR